MTTKVSILEFEFCIAWEELIKEINVMQELDHPNIVKYLDYDDNADYVDSTGSTKKVFYMALELAKGGELFDFIALTGFFSERVARYYFHQLIEAIEFMHAKGMTHRDLKPENILFDEKFNLKLADFGMVSKNVVNYTVKGSQYYMAPEISKGLGYYSHAVDTFAAGVILFMMVTQSPPWEWADPSRDSYYKQIFLNQPNEFWELHGQYKLDGIAHWSDDLRDMLTHLFQTRAMHRLSLSEIKEHPWYKGELPTYKEILEEFTERKEILDQENFQEDDDVPTDVPDADVFDSHTVHRGVSEEEEAISTGQRQEAQFIPEFKTYT